MINIIIEKIIKSKITKYEKLSKILYYLFVEKCNISQNKYYILGSYAIRKYRIISDLDINLDEIEFIKLEKLENKIGQLEFYNGQIRWFFDMTNEYNQLTGENEKDFSIEAFQKNPLAGFPNKNFSLQILIENNKLDIDENGHQFFNLNTLLEWKKTMNRQKDVSDIELINSIIKKGGNKKTNKKSSKKLSKKINKKINKKFI